jgi:hypothetical protein
LVCDSGGWLNLLDMGGTWKYFDLVNVGLFAAGVSRGFSISQLADKAKFGRGLNGWFLGELWNGFWFGMGLKMTRAVPLVWNSSCFGRVDLGKTRVF